MLHDFVMKAGAEPEVLVTGAGGGALLMFFLKDFFKRTEKQAERSNEQSDASAKAITALTKDVGLLEAARDRAKEKDDEHSLRIKELEAELRELREMFIVLRAKAE